MAETGVLAAGGGHVMLPTMSRKRWLWSAVAVITLSYLVLPIYFGLERQTTDLVFALIFGVGLTVLLFEDHRLTVPKKKLVLVSGMVFAITAGGTIAALASGYRFQIMIPVVMIVGGVAYWYLDRLSRDQASSSMSQ